MPSARLFHRYTATGECDWRACVSTAAGRRVCSAINAFCLQIVLSSRGPQVVRRSQDSPNHTKHTTTGGCSGCHSRALNVCHELAASSCRQSSCRRNAIIATFNGTENIAIIHYQTHQTHRAIVSSSSTAGSRQQRSAVARSLHCCAAARTSRAGSCSGDTSQYRTPYRLSRCRRSVNATRPMCAFVADAPRFSQISTS